MTVYRRNPLLMTVMGANPGRRVRRRDDAIDQAISQAWHRLMSGVQVPIMDIPRIFRDIKLEIAAGVPLEQAVLSVGSRYRVNKNPFGEAILAGVAGAVVNRAFQSNPGPAFVVIDATSGMVVYTKRATGMGNQAIESCVARARIHARRTGHPHIVFLDVRGVKRGMQLSVPMVRVMGITEEIFPDGYAQGPRARLNPAIQSEWDKLSTRRRLAVLEFAGIPEDHASYLCGKSWERLGAIDPRAQALVTRGWRDSSSTSRRTADTGTRMREHETTVRMNSGHLRPKRAGIWCVMCGEWLRSKGPYHSMKVGPQKGRTICDLCYRGIRSGRRAGESWARNPKSNPGGKRRLTMTIARFAAWVKSKKDPAMWRAFLAKFRGYEKWTHGARARKVTVEWVETPGVNGLWITYDGGKQPESTYIMPKGSRRKGAWKHPWSTMPDIKHDPEAGIVLTKLRGRSRITDFYHK